MRRAIAFTAIVLISSIVRGEAKDDVSAATKRLADADSYSWVSAAQSGGLPVMGGPTAGKTRKSEFTTVSLSRNSGVCIVYRGDRFVVRTPTGWLTSEQIQRLPDAQRDYVRLVFQAAQSLKLPHVQAQYLVENASNFRQPQPGRISADLSEAAAKSLISVAPDTAIVRARGVVTFWLKDGWISRYQCGIIATLKTAGNEHELDRVITTTIEGVGSTTVHPPADAQKALGIGE